MEELITRIKDINFSMRNSPQVGLFWFNKDMTKIILHRYSDANNKDTENDWKELLKSARGNPPKNLISVTPRHRELWSKLQEQNILNKLNLPKEFDDLPRGRILKNTETNKFVLYYGNWLNQKTLNLICSKFHIDESNIDLTFGYNPEHYRYINSEKDIDSLEEFLITKGVINDIRY